MRVYICKPSSNEIIDSGNMESILRNAAILKLSGELCLEDVLIKDQPGDMIGIMDGGKPYWLSWSALIAKA